jgi:hypothetical protein
MLLLMVMVDENLFSIKHRQTTTIILTKIDVNERVFEVFFSLKQLRVFMKNKEFWKTLIQIVVTVLTALTTTLGVSACTM